MPKESCNLLLTSNLCIQRHSRPPNQSLKQHSKQKKNQKRQAKKKALPKPKTPKTPKPRAGVPTPAPEEVLVPHVEQKPTAPNAQTSVEGGRVTGTSTSNTNHYY